MTSSLIDWSNNAMISLFLSFILLGFFLWGRSLWHSNLKRHIRVMTLVIAGDLSLVLSLVILRDALSKVSTGMKWSLMVHIPFAVTSVVLYLLIAVVAVGTYRGKPWRIWIRRLDRVLLPARVITSLTALLVHFY